MNHEHHYYAKEAAERCLKPLPEGELVPQTLRERIMVETAYRRGFQQGSESTYQRWRDHPYGVRVPQSWRIALHKWRFCKHNGRFTPPPAYAPKDFHLHP